MVKLLNNINGGDLANTTNEQTNNTQAAEPNKKRANELSELTDGRTNPLHPFVRSFVD